jgi:hypothetical protein
MFDEDGDEVLCGFCGETLDPTTAEQVHDNSDEDGGLMWVCGACMGVWRWCLTYSTDDAPEENNAIPF